MTPYDTAADTLEFAQRAFMVAEELAAAGSRSRPGAAPVIAESWPEIDGADHPGGGQEALVLAREALDQARIRLMAARMPVGMERERAAALGLLEEADAALMAALV